MNATVEELIHIEQMAGAVLEKAAKDKSTLSKRIQTEIEHRTAVVDSETRDAISRSYKDALGETENRIRDITSVSANSISTTKAAFERHRTRWRAELTERVLYGM